MAKPGRTGMSVLDRLILLVAWAVTCGLVYVLGFYVGQGTQERRFGVEERIVRLPVTSKPPAEGQRPKTENDLTFYDTLGSGEREAKMPAVAQPPPPPAPRPAPAAPPAPPAAVRPPDESSSAPTPPRAPTEAAAAPARPVAATSPVAPPSAAAPRPAVTAAPAPPAPAIAPRP